MCVFIRVEPVVSSVVFCRSRSTLSANCCLLETTAASFSLSSLTSPAASSPRRNGQLSPYVLQRNQLSSNFWSLPFSGDYSRLGRVPKRLRMKNWGLLKQDFSRPKQFGYTGNQPSWDLGMSDPLEICFSPMPNMVILGQTIRV